MATSLDHLKVFKLSGFTRLISSEEISNVLNHLSGPMEVIKCEFSKESFKVLVEKFSNTIRVVDFSDFYDIESSMIQQILEKSPALEEFRGQVIKGTDLVRFRTSRSKDENSSPKLKSTFSDDWKCLNLKILQICFDLEFNSYTKKKDKEVLREMDKIIQQHIFRQLSRLEFLEHLELITACYVDRSLDCRLGSNGGYLEELKPLKRLRKLKLPGIYPRMVGLEEREWVKENWGEHTLQK
jgi:hypothetical protein